MPKSNEPLVYDPSDDNKDRPYIFDDAKPIMFLSEVLHIRGTTKFVASTIIYIFDIRSRS